MTAASGVAACDRLVLPPGDLIDEIPPISEWQNFYRYSYSTVPVIDPETWTCAVEDRGVEVARMDLSFLEGLVPVPFEHTLSCYDPVARDTAWIHCARCDACRLRAKGFAEAGLEDPAPRA